MLAPLAFSKHFRLPLKIGFGLTGEVVLLSTCSTLVNVEGRSSIVACPILTRFVRWLVGLVLVRRILWLILLVLDYDLDLNLANFRHVSKERAEDIWWLNKSRECLLG